MESSFFQLSNEILESINKLSPKSRKEAMRLIGKYEFEHCAEDVFYWFDASQHVKTKIWPEGLPYVFTKDPHTIFKCNECFVEMFGDKRIDHLRLLHGEEKETISYRELLQRFTEMPAIRPFYLLEYMPPIIESWQRAQFLAIEKSRDMMATWLMITLSTWECMFHRGRQHIFQSMDASKTHELVTRAKAIWENQPDFLRAAIGEILYSKGNTRSGEIYFPSQESEILGFPQGPDQIRQFHPSLVYVDEGAYQLEAENSFTAIKPSIQQGGRFVIISSANRSWFEKIIKDRSSE